MARAAGATVVEQENLGLAAGWNRGLRETESRYVLILNADAWLVGGSGSDVTSVKVGGRTVVDAGALTLVEERTIEARAIAVLKKLAG